MSIEEQGQEQIGKTLVEVFSEEKPSEEQPVIRKKRGRPLGWKKKPQVDFQPVAPRDPKSYVKDEMTLLKEELSRLENQLTKLRNSQSMQVAPVTIENPAFKGRPLPDPLPEGFPEIDPLAGDKTPAVVEWFKEHDPKEFEARYTARARRTHLRPRAEPKNPDFILDEESGRRIKLMARTESKDGLNLDPRTYGG